MDKKLSKRAISGAVLLALAVVVYNAILFALCGFEGHSKGFWISYAFMMLCFVTVLAECYILKDRTLEPHDQILGFPILKHCTIYMIAELLASILFSALGNSIPWAIGLALQILIWGVHIAMAISCFIAKETITKLQETVKDNTASMYMLRTEAEILAGKVRDPLAKAAALNLLEQLRYSDPVSKDETLLEIETQIGYYISLAQNGIMQNDPAEIISCCEKAGLLLKERNVKCAILK